MGIKRTKWDKVFSDAVRERDNWTCQRCRKYYPEGNRQGLHCSHFFGRRKYSVRFDFVNAEALCYGCHQYFTSNPQHHREHKIRKIGSREFQKLEVRSNTTGSKRDMLSDIHYKYLKQRLEKYKERNENGKGENVK